MGGRVVEGTGLENRQAATSRGFESLPIRHMSPKSIQSGTKDLLQPFVDILPAGH